MTEFKHNIDWRHGFSPFLGVERFVERAEAARNAISEQASAAQNLFASQAQSGFDRIFNSAGKLSAATGPAERMNVISSTVMESSRAQIDNLGSWAQLYSRRYADFLASFAVKPS